MVVHEQGKKWWESENGIFTRMHDECFSGMRFEHKRCPFCARITCTATLHWLNHLHKCAPSKYSFAELLELRYKSVKVLEKTRYNYDWQRDKQ